MSKKKKIYKIILSKVFLVADYLLSGNTTYLAKGVEYAFKNMFRISMSFRQLFFSLFNLTTTFTKLFSTGVILRSQTKVFKFFKKSVTNINPLVMVIRYSFVSFFKKLYCIESVNYTKRQFTFLRKFLASIKTQLKYMIITKTWQFTTKPVKRIKRRVVKLLKNM